MALYKAMYDSSIISSPPQSGFLKCSRGLLVSFFICAIVCSFVRILDATVVSAREASEVILCLIMITITFALFSLAQRLDAISEGRVALLLAPVVFIEAASLVFAIEELVECHDRMTWCGPPDHFTTTILLSLMAHAMCFVCITSSGWRGNGFTSCSAFVGWICSLCVVLNIYNGDILSLHENYEYTLPHFLVVAIAAATDDDDMLIWATATIAIIVNLYWVGASPFNAGRVDLRHRTEFYDTQCYVCSTYHILLAHRLLRWQAGNDHR